MIDPNNLWDYTSSSTHIPTEIHTASRSGDAIIAGEPQWLQDFFKEDDEYDILSKQLPGSSYVSLWYYRRHYNPTYDCCRITQ